MWGELMRDGVLLLLLVVGALAARKRKRNGNGSPDETPPPAAPAAGLSASITNAASDGWVWPLPVLGAQRPVVSDGYGSDRAATASQKAHMHVGVDIMYKRPRRITGKYPFPDHGSPGFELPEGTSVLAAHDGTVWSAQHTALGWRIVIDHGPLPYATVYQHLESIDVPVHAHGKPLTGGPPTRVKAGDVIGVAGYSPEDSHRIRHLHFEVLNPVKQIDPGNESRGMMAAWSLIK